MIAGAFFLATMAGLSRSLNGRSDWLMIAVFRALVMLATSIVLVRTSGANLVVWRPRTLWLRSLAGSFSLICNFYTFTRLPLADAITLMNVYPLWIILISAFVLRRWPTVGEVIGVACGLAGVFFIERPRISGDGLAVIVALLGSVSTAVAMLGLNRLRDVDPRAVVAHFAGVASLISLTCLFFRWQQGATMPFEVSVGGIGLLMGVGASGTLGQILLTKAYAAGNPAKVATVGLTQVVFAMGFDVLFWNRELTPGTILGFGLVLAPTTWLSIRSARKSTADRVQKAVAEPVTRS
jgi:drug/metabolite transporter (DMT)-like permease